MSTTYLNTKSRGITKTIAEFSKQDGQSSEFREFIKEQVVEYRKDGMDVFKSQDLEMIATTNNFPSSKEKERIRDKRLFRKSK
jgi:hypothetical protein